MHEQRTGNSVEPLVQAAQKEVLDSYRREFDLLSAGFRDLDGKAQGTATIAGAFLAAGLALLNRPGGIQEDWPKALLLPAVLGLVGAIFFSIQALRIRKIPSCPSGDDVAALLQAISNQPENEIAQRLLYFYGDTAALWRTCVGGRRAANRKKGRAIWLAQLSLAISALLVAALIIGLILGI